jgi:isoleucyl-tRNA synthetase
MTVFAPLSAQPSFPKEEEQVLEHWRHHRVFARSVEERPTTDRFAFYDGPPFATGLPHYGHFVASTLKDIVPRYWTMRGKRVERRFGWDTHGLPVEMEVEKELGLNGPASIRAYGVAKFNEACRAGVLKYVSEWEKTITRLGRFVDFENDYKTMDLSFMESCWWVFAELWKKKLVYQGVRVMPYSWRLSTPLSNFEAGQDYRDVDDPALTVRFRITAGNLPGGNNASLLVWTTTPWTLPSNLAVAVGADIDYVIATVKGERVIVAAALAKAAIGDHEVEHTLKGSDLVGLRYAPIFPFFADRAAQGAFRVVASTHVTTTDGTGLVHMAPAFGEDDFQVCRREGIELVDPVNEEGNFTSLVPPYAGKNVKEADKLITADLKAQGSLFKISVIRHAYPFCWRSGTPLIYKSTPSWYIKAESLRDRMVALNDTIHWVPDSVGSARFGNWLKEARDWSVSRNRFWGTPIPIWMSEDGSEVECIGSVAELAQKTGAVITDLHPHKIDHLTYVSASGKTMKRISDVFDCWFESGAMPYAQVHYPFENREAFEASFPAQFIAEGLDQTRGWFYTLLILSTGLFDQVPFQNVVVNGLVLATSFRDDKGARYAEADVDLKGGKAFHKETGKELVVTAEKMSKRLKNYPDPTVILNEIGADALRTYLINSPVVRAEPLKFNETGVREVVRTVMLPLHNALSFFVTYANIDGWHPVAGMAAAPNLAGRPELDRWIISVLQSLVADVNAKMEGYYLYQVVPPMLAFIDDLTNWYIRRSRKRFWRNDNPADKASAYATTYEVLTTFSKLLAPVMPFFAESIYLRLVRDVGMPGALDSVHLDSYPMAESSKIDVDIEAAMAVARSAVELGRALREKHKLRTRQPLASVTLVTSDPRSRDRLAAQQALIAEELNVKVVHIRSDDAELSSISCKANFKTLGKRAGTKMKAIAAAVEAFDRNTWKTLDAGGEVVVEEVVLTRDDVLVSRTAVGEVVLQTEGDLTVALDTKLTDELRRDGLLREALRALQQARQETAELSVQHRIHLHYQTDDADLADMLLGHEAMVREEVLITGDFVRGAGAGDGQRVDVDGRAMTVWITRA